MHSQSLQINEATFDEKFSSALIKQREVTAEIGRNALTIMINKGILHHVKNITATSDILNEYIFSVQFHALMNKETEEREIIENFKEIHAAKELLNNIITLEGANELKSDLIALVNSWSGNTALEISLA